jgi:hypothetical protein
MYEDGAIKLHQQFIELPGIVKINRTTSRDRQVHVMHAKPFHDGGLVDAVIFVCATQIDDGHVTRVGKHFQRRLIRLPGRRHVIRGGYRTQLDNLFEIDLQAADRSEINVAPEYRSCQRADY